MTTIHVPPGEGRSYPMIDGEHVAKAAVHDTNEHLRGRRAVRPVRGHHLR